MFRRAGLRCKHNVTTYAYDSENNLTSNSSVAYTYDLANHLTQVVDPTGTYGFTFDADGRLTQTSTAYTFIAGKTFTVGYGYDAAANRTSMTDPQNAGTTYVYDTLNRLSSLTSPQGAFGFSYDALSRRTQLTRPNNVATNYTYDPLSRLQSVLHQLSGSTIDGATYTVDNAGNRTSKTDKLANVTSNYAYDPIYELTGVTQGGPTTESYTYDAVGNRLTSTIGSYAYNTSNEMTSSPTATFTFDNNGNSLTKADSTGTTSYAWDFENRLTSVTPPGTAGTVTFRYDSFGRRIQKSSSSGMTNFLYDGSNSLEEVDATGNMLARYTGTQNTDEPLAMLRSGVTSYYQADGLGSITSLSSATGTLANTYTYDSFGNLATSSGSITNSIRYTAREFDPETNLYFYRARYYDLAAGRFIAEDPIRWFSGAANFYGYVHNDPVNLIDPLGLRATKAATADCIARGLQALFPGVAVTVGTATKEVGGHWNFPVQLQFSSYDAASAFYSAYTTSAANGWPPPARFGPGPSLHLENLGNWSPNSGTYDITGTAHIDLYNPNGTSQGGGGVGGVAGHAGIDGVVGHLVQVLGSNIDPANCPWGKACPK